MPQQDLLVSPCRKTTGFPQVSCLCCLVSSDSFTSSHRFIYYIVSASLLNQLGPLLFLDHLQIPKSKNIEIWFERLLPLVSLYSSHYRSDPQRILFLVYLVIQVTVATTSSGDLSHGQVCIHCLNYSLRHFPCVYSISITPDSMGV